MATLSTNALIEELKRELKAIATSFNDLNHIDHTILLQSPGNAKWSVIQILEHLNSYNRYYLPLIASTIKENSTQKFTTTFKPGMLGNYFVKTMYSNVKTQSKITNPMKAPKDHSPSTLINAEHVIVEFSKHQLHLSSLIEAAEQVNWSTLKIPISISKWIKINLGDTFRFLIAHETRHFLQIKNTLAMIK